MLLNLSSIIIRHDLVVVKLRAREQDLCDPV